MDATTELQLPIPPIEAVSLSCKRFAAELNNVGIIFHERSKLDEAEVLYREAMKVLVLEQQVESDEQQQHIRECQDKLVDMKVAAHQLCNTPQKNSYEKDLFSTQIGSPFHHQLPNTFSQPCTIDVDDHAVMIGETQVALILLHNIALIQMHRGNFCKAMSLLHMALSQVTGIDRGEKAAFAFLAVHYNLGKLYYYHEGRVHESYKVLVHAVSQGRQALGSDNLLIAGVLNAVGRIMISLGFLNDAMSVFDEYSRIYDQHDITTVTNSVGGNSRSDESAAPAA